MTLPPLSLYPDEDDDTFWNEHAYIRLRPTTRLETEPAEIILENRIWFSSVASQDDIFEGSPPFETDPMSVNLQDITSLARRSMRGQPETAITAEALRVFQELSDARIFADRTAALISSYGGLFRGSSILSLFRDARVQRNWHEYASQGRGYAAVFDFREPWDIESAAGLHGPNVPTPVSYVPADKPPIITIRAAPVPAAEAYNDIETALLTKSDEWANQQEERLFRVGIGPGHVQFPTASLRAILIGYSSTEETRDRMVALCTQRQTPVPVLQVHSDPPSRRLAIRRIV